ncbi:MAG: gliding motility-associated C-terminal domain-containing protein [Saprospiraceae bacterium]|nr:gliding motility-associated C-terminal domain-containing protein [Saprospiraceae bacterium]
MHRLIILLFTFSILGNTFSLAQTEGWTSTCSINDPSVAEIMIDACSNEFRSEYIILKTRNAPFDVRNFSLNVINPSNNAYVGSVSVQNNNLNADALRRLNEAALATCGYGTVFRDAFHTPYDAVVPPNSTILVFNNKDSTDVSYLSVGELSRLCGSKVFVVFGTINSQSPGVNLFRNYPQNGSCGTTGCLRQIQFRFGGANSTYCTQFTYDIKKLPNLNTSNPPVGFNEGSYIRPAANGVLTYGGGNLTGTGVVCMPTEKLMCSIPAIPDYGNGFWNVLSFDNFNDFSTTSFRGYYQAKGNHTVSIGTATADNFEFNTVRDGWGGTQAPSEAHSILGALTTYNGCNVRADSFSILAKRKGFDCGYYEVGLNFYDEFTRMRIDNDGNGTWDFDQSYSGSACSMGCGSIIWQGFLSPQSKIEIYGYDKAGSFNLHYLFQKKSTPPSVKINVVATTPVACGGSSLGSITTIVSGGLPPYNITWTGVTPITNGSIAATNLAGGLYQMRVTDVVGCVDTAQILVPQTNNIVVNTLGDTIFCPNGIALLRGTASGGIGPLNVEWLTTTSPTVLSTSYNFSTTVSKTTSYVLRVTDGVGCYKTDTVQVKVHSLPIIHITAVPNDTVCNDAVPILRARGAQSYTWSSFPPIGAAALDARGDSARLFSLFLPAPFYIFTATGMSAEGCTNTGQTVMTIIPLPKVNITPVLDTLCDNDAPRPLTVSPVSGGTFIVYKITQTAAIPCLNCIENNTFHPERSGAGDFLVTYEVINESGCRNGPSIHVLVKSCRCTTSITVPLSKNICAGDSFRLKTTYYKATGIYQDTFSRADGCDSIVVLNLTVHKLDTTRVFIKTCNPSQVGTTWQVLRNQYGCDSLLITTKTFGRHDTTRYTYVICSGDSVFVNNTWLKTAGETRFNLQNTEGCDSIVIANITFTRLDTTYRSATSCDSMRVGLDTVRMTNRFGCDSLIVTRTTLSTKDTTRFFLTTCNPSQVGNDVHTYRNRLGCDSIVIYTYTLRAPDTTYSFLKTCNPSDTGRRQLRLQNRLGCDSIVFILTTLKRRDSTQFNRFICAGDSIGFSGRWIKTRGIYFETRINLEGCDSVLVLNLDFWKKDTIIIQKTTCNPRLVGDSVRILKGYRGCDSMVITQTRYVPSNMVSEITNLQSISCNGRSDGSLTIKINSGGTSPFNYSWGNGFVGNSVRNLSAGIHKVTITDKEGCQIIDSFHLKNPPPLSIDIIGIAPRCYGDEIGAIQVLSVGGGTIPYRLTWGALGQNLTNFPITIGGAKIGNHTFKLTDAAGCILDSVLVVPPAAERKIDVGGDITINLGDSTQIGAFLNFRNGRFKWTAKEGQIQCDTCVPTIVKPSQTTTYKLTVTDTLGCKVADELIVFVDKTRNVFIPTSFSPNGDGVNEHFTVFSDSKVRKIRTMKVFNRWGGLVFQQNDFLPNDENQGWDGTIRNVALPSETYIYFVDLEFVDGKVIQYQGDVTIIR